MFAGEAACLIPFFARNWFSAGSSRRSPGSTSEQPSKALFRRTLTAFTLPTLCDAGATTLLNLGLYYTYASVFQMLRGTLVIFAGFLTVVLLRRRLHGHHYLGIVLISAGAALVGASSIIFEKEDGAGGSSGAPTAPNPLLGNLLILIAQVLNATQFIIEEKFLRQFQPPVLLAVGSEGVVGLILCTLALPLLSKLPGPGGVPIDDAATGFKEIAADPTLRLTTIMTVLSIAAFNFCGVSVTKRLSGASRAAIDACRTAIIWLFCLRVGWERFHLLQLVGFTVLITGTSIYNDILRACLPSPDAGRPPVGSRRRSSRRIGGVGGAPGTSQGDENRGDEEEALLSESETASDEEGTSSIEYESDVEDAGRKEETLRGGVTGSGTGGTPGRPPLPRLPSSRSRPVTAPMATGGGGGGSYSTMARSVTMLPGALSPHSLASIPSGSGWDLMGESAQSVSIPENLAALGREEQEDEGSPQIVRRIE